MTGAVVVSTTIALLIVAADVRAQQALAADGLNLGAPPLALAPTSHPRLPLDATHLWLAPENGRAPRQANALASAMALLDKAQDAQALAALSQASVQAGVLGNYALFYAARAQQRLGRTTDALRTFRLIQQRDVAGYLRDAAAIGEAEALEASGDHPGAVQVYERLLKERPIGTADVLMGLGREAEAAGDRARAIEAYSAVYYDFPTSEVAQLARARLDGFPSFQRIGPGTERFKLEMGRAERLFAAKQYAPAKSAFEGIRSSASGDDREIVNLRIAESDFYLKRYRLALTGIAPYTNQGTRQAEALYFQAVASRALGDRATYLKNVRRIVDKFSDQSWAEDALNHLATQYIRHDDDDAADTVFRELLQRFPRSPHAERAAWKVGWRSFRDGRLRRDRRYLRTRRGDVSALRLSAGLALLGGPGPRTEQAAWPRGRALHTGRHRLPEQLLRPAGRRAPQRAEAFTASDRRRRRAGRAAAAERTDHPGAARASDGTTMR